MSPERTSSSLDAALCFSNSRPCPHEVIHANRFISQLSDYYPGNTPKVSTCHVTKQMEITTRIYNDIYSVGMGTLVWSTRECKKTLFTIVILFENRLVSVLPRCFAVPKRESGANGAGRDWHKY